MRRAYETKMPGATPRLIDRPSTSKALIVGGDPRPLTAPVSGKAKRLSGVRPRLLEADPRGVDQYFYNLNLFKQSNALLFLHVSDNGIKNAGGYTPALGSKPLWVDQVTYLLFALSREADKVHRGKRPRYLEACSDELTKKTYITKQAKLLVKALSSNLLHVVSLEVNPFAKKAFFGSTCLAVLVSERGQFKTAYIVGNLKQMVGGRGCIAVNDGFFGDALVNCRVNRAAYDLLTIVVIDFYSIERLKECQMVVDERAKVTLHLFFQSIGVNDFSFYINESGVTIFRLFRKNAESCKSLFTSLESFVFVWFVAPDYWGEVEGSWRESGAADGLTVSKNTGIDADRLIVEDEREQVIIRTGTSASRFVNEYREFLFHEGSYRNKNAGGNPPATSTALLAERYLVYTTTQGVLSSHNYTRTHVLKHQVNAWGGECFGC